MQAGLADDIDWGTYCEPAATVIQYLTIKIIENCTYYTIENIA